MKQLVLILVLIVRLPLYGQSRIHWLSEEHCAAKELLFSYFDHAGLLGLEVKDYPYNKGFGPLDTAVVEEELTRTAIAFFSDVVYGRKTTRVGFDGLHYTPSCVNVADSFYAAIANGTFDGLLGRLEPKSKEYARMKEMIGVFERRIHSDIFRDVNVTSNVVDSSNHALVVKLFQLGILDGIDLWIQEDTLRNKVRAFQRQFEFLEDGRLRPGIIEELNVPMEKRLGELKHAINTFRWLECMRKEQPLVVINIPAAGLYMYSKDSVLLYSRCVVGREQWPTMPLTSWIDQVILYPFWSVPKDIVMKDMWYGIKRDPVAFLEAGNYQLLDKSGRIVNPADVKWNRISKQNFPFVVRQMNGCDNSLGIIKLNFDNPYSTYMHDTPFKSYFLFNKRYFSHGCIRVEKVDALARMIVPVGAPEIPDLDHCTVPPDAGPVLIPLNKKVPLFILYEVAWPGASGDIMFFDDVYGKFH